MTFPKIPIVIIAIAFLTLLLVVLFIAKLPQPAKEVSVSEPEVIPEAVSSLASGKRTYELMTNNPQNLQIIKVEVDPLDVEQGGSQQVMVWVEDSQNNPITAENKVEGIIYTDNGTTTFSFQLKEASDANSATLTLWQGAWVLNDTNEKTYMMEVAAKSADREDKIELTFR